MCVRVGAERPDDLHAFWPIECRELIGRKWAEYYVRFPRLRYRAHDDLPPRYLGKHTPPERPHLSEERARTRRIFLRGPQDSFTRRKDRVDDRRPSKIDVFGSGKRYRRRRSNADVMTFRDFIRWYV